MFVTADDLEKQKIIVLSSNFLFNLITLVELIDFGIWIQLRLLFLKAFSTTALYLI